ncbi:hypothetical protein CEXT_541001 [Caerostris extrusa]|uniref:Uncharacterized protein n=1 Tax=Caerostris extrusa TaxID=172846 RepID=A0AAV4YGA9_CAEEX|nr:hypothetical protein CEXT_541001 [Caerostris extrusa]
MFLIWTKSRSYKNNHGDDHDAQVLVSVSDGGVHNDDGRDVHLASWRASLPPTCSQARVRGGGGDACSHMSPTVAPRKVKHERPFWK